MYEIRKIDRIVSISLIVFMILSVVLPLTHINAATKQVITISLTDSYRKSFNSNIKKQQISIDVSESIEKIKQYIDMEVPKNKLFKSYMDERFISSKTSKQYLLKEKYELDESTGIYTVDNRYCCALGSYYTTNIGQEFDVVMKSGETIPCILADCKDDKHTDSLNQYTIANGSVVEFVVDEEILIPKISINGSNTGDISTLDGIFKGEIDYIRIYH